MKNVLNMLLVSIAMFAFAAPVSVSAETHVKAQAHQVKKVKKALKTPERKCQETPQRIWFIANVGTIERPMLRGFCRKAQPVSPFAELA